ncbi:MAG: hypothetical protein JNK35_01185 [Phycisphaerae bacterium]|nr:hypothetical protein [Phycisphaerae bacterium]
MNLIGFILLWGWTPVAVALRAVLSARTGTVVIGMLGWMFLPQAGFKIPGVPLTATNKMGVMALSMLLAAAVYDQAKFARLRFSLIDLVAVGWLVAPLVTGAMVGAAWEEAVGFTLQHATVWIVPYVIGRVVLSERGSLRMLLWVVVLCAAAYAPLCWFEMRFSPQLHNWTYGFHQHSFIQARRGDGFRPTVFMQHGLAVALFMSMGMVAAFALWMTEAKRARLHAGLAALVLGATLVGCKSFGAMALGAGGIGVLLACRALKATWPLAVLALVPMVYVVARTAGGWSGEELVSLVSVLSDRDESLAVRLRSEASVWEALGSNRMFGVLRFSTFKDIDEGTSVFADGLWLIALNRTGIVGLCVLFGLMVLPSLAALRRVGSLGGPWADRAPVAGAAYLAIMLSFDNLANCMFNPLMGLVLGGLVTYSRLPRAGVLGQPIAGPGLRDPGVVGGGVGRRVGVGGVAAG